MSINTTTSSISSTSQVSTSQSSEISQKNNSDTSFKDEMEKVSASQDKDSKDKDVTSKSDDKIEKKSEETLSDKVDNQLQNAANSVDVNDENLKFASLSMMDVNNRLSNDIIQMMNNSDIAVSDISGVTSAKNSMTLDFSKDGLFMSESDAQFFINLTQNDTISVSNVVAQAQNMINSGADFSEVQKNVNISQTLLDAIAKAKDTNQPLRIDFDQNVAVILRISKDGTLAANFIPGDKAVEKYLKDNIESLKATFDEADLPYSDLSYQSRGSKHQKEQRRNR